MAKYTVAEERKTFTPGTSLAWGRVTWGAEPSLLTASHSPAPCTPVPPPTLCSHPAGAQPAPCITLILVLLLPSAQASCGPLPWPCGLSCTSHVQLPSPAVSPHGAQPRSLLGSALPLPFHPAEMLACPPLILPGPTCSAPKAPRRGTGWFLPEPHLCASPWLGTAQENSE